MCCYLPRFRQTHYTLEKSHMKEATLVKSILVLILLKTLLISCSNENIDVPKNYEIEHFELLGNKDTTITTKERVKITIHSKTFGNSRDIVTLEVITAIDKLRMIRYNLGTLSSNGKILESDGMINISANRPIDAEYPIRISLPTEEVASSMRLFK